MRQSVAAAVAAFVGLAACGDGVPTDAPHDLDAVAVTLAAVRGDSQIGEVGRLLEDFLVFRVTGPDGRPVAGVRVEWEVMAGGGKVSGKRHETDAAGLAAGNFTLGPQPGQHVARAVVYDSLAIAFTAFALPASSGALPIESRSSARPGDWNVALMARRSAVRSTGSQ